MIPLRTRRTLGVLAGLLASVAVIGSSLAASNVRLTNDDSGYVSAYTLATGHTYSDPVLDECSASRGRQNEPAVEADPRNPNVLIGSSNDYCAVYQPPGSATPSPTGPIWLGYYRSENAGTSFVSSLVPGYPGDTSPYANRAHIRTASAGDPVIAWDRHGRAFMGAESSDDPSGTKKSFGDVWVAAYDNPDGVNGNIANDGKRFVRSEIVNRGSSAPNYLGVFNDKTAIEADRTGRACDGYVYFAWSRFTGNGTNNIYISRSTDHGATWSNPKSLTSVQQDVQFPDIAVTANGHVYVTFRQFARKNGQPNAVDIAKSTDCGATFGPAAIVKTFIPYDASDVAAPQAIPAGSSAEAPLDAASSGGNARDCGDFSAHCQSGYTFFRRDTQVRSTTDQGDTTHEYVYIVYDPSKPGTSVATGTTYGSTATGVGSQSGIYFIRYNGATGAKTDPALIDSQPTGHQLFPDISASRGYLHTIWWDSRNDPSYSPARPIGNDAAGHTVASLDVYGAVSTDAGTIWTVGTNPLTTVRSNPNYEQFGGRTVPFAGDYLWVTSSGATAYAVWTDWRDTVQHADPREITEDNDNGSADVKQCRTFSATTGWSGDTCPHAGGLDQNIYGGVAP